MGLKDLIKNTLWRIDLLSAPPTLRTRQQPAYQTLLGGVISIVVLGVFYYFLYVQLNSMFQKLTISYNQGLVDNVDATSTITSFPFAVSIEGVDLSTNPKQFIFKLSQNQLTKSTGGGPPTLTSTNLNMSRCNQSDWTGYGSSFQGQFNAFGFGQMLCLQQGQNISMAGYEGSNTYQYLSLQISACNQSLDTNCDTSANINSFITNHQSINDYFKVRLYVVDSIITPSSQISVSNSLEKNIFLAFSSTVGTVGYINMAEYTIKTDNSLFPINNYEEQTGIYIDDYSTNAVSLSTTRYVHLNVYRSTKSTTVTRVIGKLDTILSYVGGLFSLIFTALSFFLGSYSQYKYELYVAQSTLTDDQGRSQKANDMNFYNFLIYCCYDWLATFNLAPQCMQKYKRIHALRQESCDQLDPTILLRRIKHLQDTCKVLIGDNKDICLYLTQPMNLKQAKDLRNRLTYYDEVMNEMQEGQDSSSKVANQLSDEANMIQKNNMLENDSALKLGKEVENEAELELTEEQEKQFLGNLIYDAIDKLDNDKSEVSTRIRNKISQRMKCWLKVNKKTNKDSEDSGNEKRMELMSPVETVKDEDSLYRLEPSKNAIEGKRKIQIKKTRL